MVIDGPDGQKLDAAFWYPSSAPAAPERLGLQDFSVAPNGAVVGHDLKLIVLSHGALGSWANNADTAVALARAGFVAAALTFERPLEKGAAARPMRIADNDAKLQALINFAVTRWRGRRSIDPGRMGAFGFSLGAFTVLTSLGGRPDFRRVEQHCRDEPREWSCTMRDGHHLDVVETGAAAGHWIVEPRIKAAVLAAPALGHVFGKQGLAAIVAPIQLWEAGDDRVLAGNSNAEAVLHDLSKRPEFHLVSGADHADFSQPCAPNVEKAAPALCSDASHFDRARFHTEFNASVVAFFQKNLAAASKPATNANR